MMGDDFRRGRGALGLIAQDFGGAAVQRLTTAFEQAVVGGILDQGVLEAIVSLRSGGAPSTNRRSASASRSNDA
jgi:hypothetical protein